MATSAKCAYLCLLVLVVICVGLSSSFSRNIPEVHVSPLYTMQSAPVRGTLDTNKAVRTPPVRPAELSFGAGIGIGAGGDLGIGVGAGAGTGGKGVGIGEGFGSGSGGSGFGEGIGYGGSGSGYGYGQGSGGFGYGGSGGAGLAGRYFECPQSPSGVCCAYEGVPGETCPIQCVECQYSSQTVCCCPYEVVPTLNHKPSAAAHSAP